MYALGPFSRKQSHNAVCLVPVYAFHYYKYGWLCGIQLQIIKRWTGLKSCFYSRPWDGPPMTFNLVQVVKSGIYNLQLGEMQITKVQYSITRNIIPFSFELHYYICDLLIAQL